MFTQAENLTTAQNNASLDIKSLLIYGIMELTIEERKTLLEMWRCI